MNLAKMLTQSMEQVRLGLSIAIYGLGTETQNIFTVKYLLHPIGQLLVLSPVASRTW
jgi:hypothetical protein